LQTNLVSVQTNLVTLKFVLRTSFFSIFLADQYEGRGRRHFVQTKTNKYI